MDPFVIDPSDQALFDGFFADLATDGLVSGGVAGPFFLKSGLTVDQLRYIWNLADLSRRGSLSHVEFSIAMQLIVCCSRRGVPLPLSLPTSLLQLAWPQGSIPQGAATSNDITAVDASLAAPAVTSSDLPISNADDTLDSACVCAICSDICVQPVTAACGQHNFCLVHLAEWIRASLAVGAPPLCPTCGEPIQTDIGRLRINVTIDRLITARLANTAQFLTARVHPGQTPASDSPLPGDAASDVSVTLQIATSATIPWSSIDFERDASGDRIELGRGAFGSVFAAQYSCMRVAVKVLALGGSQLLTTAMAALRREAALQASLAHENVVRVYGLAESRGENPQYGLVMARLDRDLASVLARIARDSASPAAALAAFPMHQRLRAVRELAAGLAHLHRNRVVHGDLKPGNVLVDAPERGGSLQLTDFGYSRVLLASDDDGTVSALAAATGALSMSGGDRRGTVRYMAPELLAPPEPGRLPVRPGYRTDVYAWSFVAWQVLAAAPLPFPGMLLDVQVERAVERGDRPDWGPVDAAADVHPSAALPPGLKELICQCWAAEAGARPRTAAEVLERLIDVLRVPLAASPTDAGGAVAGTSNSSLAAAAAVEVAVAAVISPVAGGWQATLRLTGPCPVCADDECPPGVAMGCGGGGDGPLGPHALCLPCALRCLRGELVPGATLVRCSQCLAEGNTLSVSATAVAEIAAWSRSAERTSATGDLRPLSDAELARHAAMVAAAAQRAEQDALPEGSFKRCPSCGTGVQRPRGHHCHHISPGTGCTNCHRHWCYSCRHLYGPGESHNLCPNGCRLFCWEGCDCPDCPDCRPGQPCDDCSEDGRCWVCVPRNRPPLARTTAPAAAGRGASRAAVVGGAAASGGGATARAPGAAASGGGATARTPGAAASGGGATARAPGAANSGRTGVARSGSALFNGATRTGSGRLVGPAAAATAVPAAAPPAAAPPRAATTGTPSAGTPVPLTATGSMRFRATLIAQLVGMGITESEAREALEASFWDVRRAAERHFGGR